MFGSRSSAHSVADTKNFRRKTGWTLFIKQSIGVMRNGHLAVASLWRGMNPDDAGSTVKLP
eukprot:3312207-Rhodomonas_salina.1